MRLRHYMYRGETRMSVAFVTITLHFTCFYRPKLIARLFLKSHNNGARCDLWRAREIGYARQMKRPRTHHENPV